MLTARYIRSRKMNQKIKNILSTALFIVLAMDLFNEVHANPFQFDGPEDCIENGGKFFCTDPVKMPWRYSMCRPGGAYSFFWRIHCEQWSRGVYVPGYNSQCIGAEVVYDEGTVKERLEDYQKEWTGQCDVTAGDYTWPTHPQASQGEPGYEYDGCWQVGSDSSDPDAVTSSFTRSYMSGTQYDSNDQCTLPIGEDKYFALHRGRKIECPAGYSRHTTTNNKIICHRKYDNSCPIDNPVLPISLVKLQTETHYKGTELGQLHFLHHFYGPNDYKLFTDGSPRESQGYGVFWRTNYDKKIIPVSGSAHVMAYAQRGNSDLRFFDLSGQQILNVDGAKEQLEQLSNGWRYITKKDTVEEYDSEGKLISITQRSGLIETLIYSDQNTPVSVAPEPGLLIEVQDDFNRSLLFTYNAEGHLITMTDPANEVYEFTYNSRGLLSTATTPMGNGTATRTYTYEALDIGAYMLTGIIDENGKRYITWNYDTNGNINSIQHANNAGYIQITPLSNTTNRIESLIKINDDDSEEYLTQAYNYADANGVLKFTGITNGECISCENSAKVITYETDGFRNEVTDFNGNITDYDYNTRGLETQRIEAKGDPLKERRITTVWDPNFRVPKEVWVYDHTDTLVKKTINTYDTQGRLKTQTIETPDS